MNNRVLAVYIFIFFFALSWQVDAKQYMEFEFNSININYLPGGFYYTSVIENYFPDTVLLIEESNGFSLTDNPRVYYEGDSQIHFNWFYNNFNINSSLNPGSLAVIPPLSSISGYLLESETPFNNTYGMNFLSNHQGKEGLSIKLSFVIPDLGSYSSFGPFFIFNHAVNRAAMLYETRRKFSHNIIFDINYLKELKNLSYFTISSTYYNASRKFNNFNIKNNTFLEDSNIFLLSSSLKKRSGKDNGFELFTIINIKNRTNQGAELGRYPQETKSVDRFASIVGAKFIKKNILMNLSITYEQERIGSQFENFAKDIFDNDGEGMGFDYKLGNFRTLNLRGSIKTKFNTNLFKKQIQVKPYLKLSIMRLYGDEKKHQYNSLYFNNHPYLVLLWDNRETNYSNNSIFTRGGINVNYGFSDDITIISNIFIRYNGLFFSSRRNNLNFLNPGFDIGLLLFKEKKINLLLSYGLLPYDTMDNLNFFLETQRPGGEYYYWKDKNGNNLFDLNETGDLYGYSGGEYHYLDSNLKSSYKYRFLLSINSQISKHWQLSVKGIYKMIKNTYRIKFIDDYGYYKNIDGVNLFFFDKPFKEYYLFNLTAVENPFYAQLSFLIKGAVENKWFFNFSFLAHIGMGYTAFGNGAGTSDIGIINESCANPNSLINSYGRVDGDRAFVSKCFFGFYLFKNCFFGAGLKYRDGNPFAFINYEVVDGQYQLFYNSIKAEDQYGNKPGPREDYLSELNLKISYYFPLFGRKINLSLSYFNVLDFGSELSEFVFVKDNSRPAVELQIPRSILLSISL